MYYNNITDSELLEVSGSNLVSPNSPSNFREILVIPDNSCNY